MTQRYKWVFAALTSATILIFLRPGLVHPAALSAQPIDSQTRAQALEQLLFGYTNAYRTSSGLPALDLDLETLDPARSRAADLVLRPSNQIGHFDPDGHVALRTLLTSSAIPFEWAGENLAWTLDTFPNPASRAIAALMASPGHRALILSPHYERLAVGVAVEDGARIMFVQIFRSVTPDSLALLPNG